MKFLEADEENKNHSHWQFLGIWKGLWRIYLESLYVNTAQIGNKWDCWESSARVKEGVSVVLLQSGLNENWWQIRWNVAPICVWLGRLYTKDVLGNHFKDRSFRLVHWLSITLSLRKTSQESINLERRSYLDCSSNMHCTPGEFGRVTYWLKTFRSGRRWKHRKSTRKDSI